MTSVYQKIIGLLNQHTISYQIFEHTPVITSQEAMAVRGTNIEEGAKSLIFMADGKPILLVLAGNKKVDTKKVKVQLHIKDLRMATHQEVFDLTTCEVGGVPPIGVVMNLPTYLDEGFLGNTKMDFNAGDRAKSIEMQVSDFVEIVNPMVFAFSFG